MEECLQKAETLKSKTNPIECIEYYLLSTSPELGLELGLQIVKSKSFVA